MKVESNEGQHVFEVQIFLNDLDLNAVGLSFMRMEETAAIRYLEEMKRARQIGRRIGRYVYSTAAPRRVRPEITRRADTSSRRVAVPLEAAQILWQRS